MTCHRLWLTVHSLYSGEMRTYSKLQTVPRHLMSRSEVFVLHCLLQNTLRAAAAQEQEPTPKPAHLWVLPTTSGRNHAPQCCVALYHHQCRACCDGALEEAASISCPPAEGTALDKQQSCILDSPRMPQAKRSAGAPQQVSPTVPDFFSISGWDKSLPPHCLCLSRSL